jgi:glycosyltransferase involved in cell wall biosynthesis
MICLGMFVRNEARVIERALASVRPFISSWVVIDTGSTDGTPELVRRALEGVPGELLERPWSSYGEASDELLRAAEGRGQYLWILDADEEVQLTDPFLRPFPKDLAKDAYYVRTRFSVLDTDKPRILRLGLPWHHPQRRHASPRLRDRVPVMGRIPGLLVQNHGDGNQGSMSREAVQERYERDVQHFLGELELNPDDTRSWFYLAQSLRDSGDLEAAITTYRHRATLGGWEEERFYSLLQVAIQLERTKAGEADVVAAYLEAYEARPTRAEPLCYLARYYRTLKKYALALTFAEAAVEIRRPVLDRLFIDWTVYEWRSLDEVGLAHLGLGNRTEAKYYSRRLLALAPAEQHFRIRRNIAMLDAAV